MFSFYTIVTIIAIVLLILALVIIGVSIRNNSLKDEFPDYQYICPDTWKLQDDQKTCVPSKQQLNNPDLNSVTRKSINHPGVTLTSDSNKIASIDLTTDSWSSLCEKTRWAKSNKIMWDGIANSNTCG